MESAEADGKDDATVRRLVTALQTLFAWPRLPWAFLGVTAVAIVIQSHAAWRDILIYDRAAIVRGEAWRIWTGHLIHFGWPHFVIDAGLFLILGRLLERDFPVATRTALVALPAFISGWMFLLDSGMDRYGGLSAVNLGLLVFMAAQGWQKNWTDWFWPGVLLIYIGEVVLEISAGHGHGGGMIRFDDPSIHVATSAHIAGALYGVALAVVVVLSRRRAAAGRAPRA
jgi:rhomboid family GlyGly-CTERM serine protease